MAEIAILNRSKLDDAVLAFHVEALRIQHLEHFCPAWAAHVEAQGFPALPWPIVFYREPPSAPDVYPVAIVDALPEGELGDHSFPGVMPVGRALDPGGLDATTPSHECLELPADPTCDLWRPWPAGGSVALETADPVEGDAYPIDVTLFGETRRVLVSNFVLPSWFVADSAGPWDYMGRLSAPFTMTEGGYVELRAADGTTSQVFARGTSGEKLRRVAAKLANPSSRLHRRLVG